MESLGRRYRMGLPGRKLLQFERDGKIHSRYPVPMKVTGEEADGIEEDIPPD
jgi:hypothetical protein